MFKNNNVRGRLYGKFFRKKGKSAERSGRENKVYFLDATALMLYSGKLYGCFLFDTFDSQYLIPGKNNIFYTDEYTLKELASMESSRDVGVGLYYGYTNFIRTNFKVISEKEYNDALIEKYNFNEGAKNKLLFSETGSFARTIECLLYLRNVMSLSPILVTTNFSTELAAKRFGFEVYERI